MTDKLMPIFKKKDEKTNDKKENRREFRLARIQEITAKAYAIAAKRKWLFLMIVSIITGYLVFKFV